jgi:CheY-like chemotaxis protein/HPt (histidine-containing phosphotransfer) domain-containing protein
VTSNRILIAEDNEANRLLALAQLERLGYEGHAVADGAEAVEAVSANDYALVLMDCRMPGVDGMTAARVIRDAEEGTGAHTIIVAMTAASLDDDRVACLDAGMDDYLCKPVLLADLRRVFAKWLDDVPAADVHPMAPAGGDPAPAAIDRETFDRFRREVGADEFARQFVEIYLGELDGRLAAIRQGREEADAELLTRVAHTLKSTSATLGAACLAERCRALETAGSEPSAPHIPALIEDVRTASEAVRRALLTMGYEQRNPAA